MYLSNIQLLKLIFPFILASILYFYSDALVEDADNVFPTIREYSNKELDKKANVYLKIQRDRDIYATIQQKMRDRETNRKWISDHLLYAHKKVTKKSGVRDENKPKKPTWNLQILYPNKKVAIINHKIVREGGMIGGARLIKITPTKVLLKTKKGLLWVSLFR